MNTISWAYRISILGQFFLSDYNRKKLHVEGQCTVNFKIERKARQNLSLIVVKERGLNIAELDWSDMFHLTKCGISDLQSVSKTNHS